jgi:hypothetical protein
MTGVAAYRAPTAIDNLFLTGSTADVTLDRQLLERINQQQSYMGVAPTTNEQGAANGR